VDEDMWLRVDGNQKEKKGAIRRIRETVMEETLVHRQIVD
jgi:hypothetical protein